MGIPGARCRSPGPGEECSPIATPAGAAGYVAHAAVAWPRRSLSRRSSAGERAGPGVAGYAVHLVPGAPGARATAARGRQFWAAAVLPGESYDGRNDRLARVRR